MKKKKTNLFIDAEWYLNQRIFLIGYATEEESSGKIEVEQLYRKNIFRKQIERILAFCNGTIYIYGPDVGMLEKRFAIPIREKYRCVNLLKVVKQLLPNRASYKLADMEKHFGYHRKADKYKKNIFDIYKDWHNPKLRQIVLDYNYEDVLYLAKIKQRIFKKFKPSDEWLSNIALASKSIAAMITSTLLTLQPEFGIRNK